MARTPSKSHLWDFWPLSFIWSEWWGNMTWTTKRERERQRQWQINWEHPQRGIFEDILRTSSNANPREYQSVTINSLLWIQTLPDQTGGWQNFAISAKFHKFGQISQSWNTYILLVYLCILEYLELGQFRNFCDVFHPEKAKKKKLKSKWHFTILHTVERAEHSWVSLHWHGRWEMLRKRDLSLPAAWTQASEKNENASNVNFYVE